MIRTEDCTYPSAPGHRGVETSIEAAESIQEVSGHIRRTVFGAIKKAGDMGLTAHELAVTLHMERTTCQPRTSELRILGKIKDSGQRRRNPNGKRAIVWVAIGGAE
jgi:hypothetical protein